MSTMHEYSRLPAVELARRVRTQQVSPTELLEVHIERIESVNARLNALVADNFAAARRRAAEIEADLEQGRADPNAPFLGVPFTVKELIGVRGQPNTGGVPARAGIFAEQDSPLVRRLRDAGGIVLGVTNVSAAGIWLESHNRVYGRTNNPHSVSRTAGGSSGGEAAIIAAGGSPMGIGADIGGSIRNPCFFNGIYGHKPSAGLLPSTGHWPPAEGQRGRFCVSGPMARSVADLEAMMEVFSPADDPYRDKGRARFSTMPAPDPGAVTVYYFESNGLTPVSAAVKRSINEAVSALEKRGHRVEAWRPKGIWRAAELWMCLVSRSSEDSVRALLGDGIPISCAKEWGKTALGRSNLPLYALIMASLERVGRSSEKRFVQLREHARRLREEIESKLDGRGVLVCPVYPQQAPRHNHPLLSPLAFSYCGIFNVLELPATAVPTRTWPGGLPVGVQIVGRRFDDALTLAMAALVEENTGGFRPAGSFQRR
jgi:fatty acid amide hydrolase 2